MITIALNLVGLAIAIVALVWHEKIETDRLAGEFMKAGVESDLRWMKLCLRFSLYHPNQLSDFIIYPDGIISDKKDES